MRKKGKESKREREKREEGRKERSSTNNTCWRGVKRRGSSHAVLGR